MKVPVKNRAQRIIAYTEDTVGRFEVFDTSNKLLAYFSKLNNETRDAKNNVIGRGNLTGRFIPNVP